MRPGISSGVAKIAAIMTLPVPVDEQSLVETTPTEAHQALVTLLNRVVVEAARRCQDELPGLVETLRDEVLLTAGGTSRPAYGWFAEKAWRFGERRVHEVFLNADRRFPHPGVSPAEDVLITLLHESCHVWAKANGIEDTCHEGRYHNGRFAKIAQTIGLVTVRLDNNIGYGTPSLTPQAQDEYADLLNELENGLVLAREPRLSKLPSDNGDDVQPGVLTGPSGSPAPTAKYVFASCQCQDGRRRRVTIRVAAGSWRPGVIRCSECRAPFTESQSNRRRGNERRNQ